MADHSHVMTDPRQIKTFALAGLATLTLRSQRTGKHYTYKIKQAVDENGTEQKLWYLRVLVDGDRYAYIGVINGREQIKLTARSTFTEDAPSVKAFRFFWHNICQGRIGAELEIRHEGRCGRCGRELTHPESIDSGIGPVCAGLMAA